MVANAIAEGKPGYEKVRDYLIPTWHQHNVQCVVKNSKLREGESTNKQGSSVRDSSPDEVAGLVSYLVSAEATMITGQSVRLFAFLLSTLSKCFWHFKVSINGGMYFDWCTSWNLTWFQTRNGFVCRWVISILGTTYTRIYMRTGQHLKLRCNIFAICELYCMRPCHTSRQKPGRSKYNGGYNSFYREGMLLELMMLWGINRRNTF